MKSIAAALSVLLITACTHQPPAPSPVTYEGFVSLVVTSPSVAYDLCSGISGKRNVDACVVVSDTARGRQCSIISPRPTSLNDHEALRMIGHELYRCLVR